MITKSHITKTLSMAGLGTGDHVIVHSSLKNIGPIENGAGVLIDALLEIVGTEGALAMPSFNYTNPLPDPYFDVLATPGRTGALTEVFRQQPGTIRSYHPAHSVSACGKRACEFLADHRESFGINSPIDRIAQAGGYVLLLGVTHWSNSMIHIGESYAGVKKFFKHEGPLPTVKMRLPDGRFVEHQLDCTSSCSHAFNAVEFPLRCRNGIIDFNLGNALCFLMKGQEVIDTVVAMIRERPDILFCHNLDCRCCTEGRKYLQWNRTEKITR